MTKKNVLYQKNNLKIGFLEKFPFRKTPHVHTKFEEVRSHTAKKKTNICRIENLGPYRVKTLNTSFFSFKTLNTSFFSL